MIELRAPIRTTDLPGEAGAYVLELSLRRRITLHVGALGPVTLGPGRLRYCGSARGPGGIRARVARHLRADKPRRWHIDTLTEVAKITRVLVVPDGHECALVAEAQQEGWTIAHPNFGSSDCRTCDAHLLARR